MGIESESFNFIAEAGGAMSGMGRLDSILEARFHGP